MPEFWRTNARQHGQEGVQGYERDEREYRPNYRHPLTLKLKGGPKAAPSPGNLERVYAVGGSRRISPFKVAPKDLQRAGCINITPRIHAVN